MRRRTASHMPALFVAGMSLLAGCGGPVDPSLPPSSPISSVIPRATTVDVAPHETLVATATVPMLEAFAARGDRSPAYLLPNPGPSAHDPRVLVVAQDGDPEWLQVQLPVRPNGTLGWVRRADVELTSHEFRIEVSLSRFELVAYRGADEMLRTPVAIGAERTPTPLGTFYVNHVERRSDPDTVYGAWILGTSGFSEVLDQFDGGEPAIALHGTNGPEVIGTSVSNGCIRMTDDAVTVLATTVPLGTPVTIVA